MWGSEFYYKATAPHACGMGPPVAARATGGPGLTAGRASVVGPAPVRPPVLYYIY